MEKTLLFNRWDLDVRVEDAGLRKYMNLRPIIVPRTFGRVAGDFRKNQMSIVERFMNKLMVPGHAGKRHKLTSGHCSGNYHGITSAVKDAFELIESEKKQNPIQVLVNAIENAALLEEIAAYRLGGMIARKSVITSPQRRVDLALKHMAQGIYRSCFNNRKSLARAIANELIAIAGNDSKTLAVRERNRMEKEAEGAR